MNRRQFLQNSLLGGLSAAAVAGAGSTFAAAPSASRVSLTAGGDHVDTVFQSLKFFARDISRSIGSRRVVIKPNNVAIDVPLCATPAESIEAILEFLKSIGKIRNAIIAESAASGPTLEGFANYGYPRLAAKYGVKLVDLDQDQIEILHVFNERDFRPHPVRVCRNLLDPGNFIISATRPKTHDRVVATLSLKNIIVGAPIKDAGFRWGKGRREGALNDKPIVHGSGFRGVNYNLFALAPRLHPHLAVIDGYQGMEGNGPTGGTPVDHRVAVTSLDWLAADRVAVELMGIDFAKVGYLNYCAQARLGEADLGRIEVLGEPVQRHIKPYQLHRRVEEQLIWMKPARQA